MKFDRFVVGLSNNVAESFMVGRGVNMESLLVGRSSCRSAAASDPLVGSSLWVAFPGDNLDSERLFGWLFW